MCFISPLLGAATLFLFHSVLSGHFLAAQPVSPPQTAAAREGLRGWPAGGQALRLPKGSTGGRRRRWCLLRGPLSTGRCGPAVTDKDQDTSEAGTEVLPQQCDCSSPGGAGGHPRFGCDPAFCVCCSEGPYACPPPHTLPSQVRGCSVYEDIQNLRTVK